MIEGAKTKFATIMPNLDYIIREEGNEGLNLLVEEMRKKGCSNLCNFKPDDWIPLKFRKELLLALRDLFGWDETKIYDMGLKAPGHSSIVKWFFNNYVRIETLFEMAPRIWRAHYSAGSLEVLEFKNDGREGYGKIAIKNFDLNPLFCRYLEGYLLGIIKLTRVKNPKIKEVKCTFRGDEHHEYFASWED